MLRIIITLVATLIGLAALPHRTSASPSLDGRWQLGLTFGEIPILAGSFKPGLTVGYHLNEQVFLGMTTQLHDHIQRDGESFNARNTGLAGLLSSKERTGARVFLGARLRPGKWWPYAQVGVVFNDVDREVMRFDARTRQIGDGSYSGPIEVVQTRPSGIAPAVGVGYQVDLDNGMSFNTGFAMGFLGPVPTPTVSIRSESPLVAEDEARLRTEILDGYSGNSHNRYHIFQLGFGYRF